MKQIIVMRTDLGMRKGKMIAQGAHASMGAILPYVGSPLMDSECPEMFVGGGEIAKVRQWLGGSFTKICVRADSEQELMALHERAVEADLIACLITDSGRTEFGGVPTRTCLAIGPDTEENLSPVTGHLRLL